MSRVFVETYVFRKTWSDAGYNDEDLKELQTALLENPEAWTGIFGRLFKSCVILGKAEIPNLMALLEE